MGIINEKDSNFEDSYFDYSFEEVMFRRDHQKNEVFRKFYGECEELKPVLLSNRLYTDARRFGRQITSAEYSRGREKIIKINNDRFKVEDIYIDDPYEEVMFRSDYKTGEIFRKFYGEAEELYSSVERLYFDALLESKEITQEEYLIGKERRK